MISDEPTLFERLRKGAGSAWTDFVDHPFVRGLADGTLPPATFRAYLMQDYLFLIHFVRANALAAYKSTSLEDIESAAATITALLGEMKMHVSFCARWGIDESRLREEREALETVAYTRFVFERGTAGDLLDLIVALAPCIQGYAEIGAAIAHRSGHANPYHEWIDTYAGDDYQAAALASKQALERIGMRAGAAARIGGLQSDFDAAVRLETAFWDMGLRHGARG